MEKVLAKIQVSSKIDFVPTENGPGEGPGNEVAIDFSSSVVIREDEGGQLSGDVEGHMGDQLERYVLGRIQLGENEITFSFQSWHGDEAVYRLEKKGEVFSGSIEGTFHASSRKREIRSGTCFALVAFMNQRGEFEAQRA